MNKQEYDIDLVYLWVDGSDEKWLARKNAFLEIESLETQNNCKGRYTDNNELKYSLRSVEKFAPWIRKIFIITDNQIPDWLSTANPQLTIIDHTEILPKEALPCYNASVLEYFIYKIPNLAEHFLFSNDDTMFNAPLTPGFFFTDDGFPIVRLRRKNLKLRAFLKALIGKKLSAWRKIVLNSTIEIEKRFGIYYPGIPHHNIDSYLKSDYQHAVEKIFSEEIKKSLPHHIRSGEDMHRSGFSLYVLAIKHGHLRYVDKKESCVIRLERKNYSRYLDSYQPKLICMNDSERVSDNDRERAKIFLENLFPKKSAFEK